MTRSKGINTLAVVMTAGLLMAGAQNAFAMPIGNGFDDGVVRIVSSASPLPSMVEIIAYFGGIFLCIAGIFKLIKRACNSQRHTMKGGLICLGGGIGLMALPYLMQTVAHYG